MTDFPGQRQPTEEVAQIVGQTEQLQPNLIVNKVMTGQPRPAQGVFAFLDPLFSSAPLIVKPNYPTCEQARFFYYDAE